MRAKTFSVSILVLVTVFHAAAQNRWQEIFSPTTKDLRKVSFLDGRRGWVCGNRGAILKTTDGGNVWTVQDAGIDKDIQDIFFLNERLGWSLAFEPFVDTLTWYGTKILRTTNGGSTWANRQYAVSGEFFSSIHFLDSLRGWMGGEFGHIVRTSDGGATWFPAEVDSSNFAHWGIINIKFFTPQIGFAMGGRLDVVGVVWRTTNAGVRWKAYGVAPEPVHDLHMIDSLNMVGVAGDVDYGASLIRTTNAGEEWVHTYLNIFGEPRALSFRTPAEAWSPLGFAAFLMYTTDTGATWTTVETPRRKPIYDLVFSDSSTGFAVGDSGIILKYSGPTLSISENLGGSSYSFSLHQNYPNPFNPSTTIMFDLPEERVVTIEVFNVLGQKVRTLLHQSRNAGRHFINFDGVELPSGVYLYRLRDGNRSLSKRMLLAK